MRIETERLVLRPFKIEDTKSIHTLWAQDEDISRYAYWSPSNCLEDTQKLVQSWIDGKDGSFKYLWAIVLKENNIVIGNIHFHNVNDKYRNCETGYLVAKKYWKKGIATEALKVLINYGFYELGFIRIYATSSKENLASRKVMEKCGMEFEGILRKAILLNTGEFDDAYIHSIIREDYINDEKTV